MYTAENAPGVAVLLSGDADVPGPLTGLPTHQDNLDTVIGRYSRLIVVGADADLGAVLTRLLRTDRLDVEVGYVPRRRSPATRAYRLPAGRRAARRARRSTAATFRRRLPQLAGLAGSASARCTPRPHRHRTARCRQRPPRRGSGPALRPAATVLGRRLPTRSRHGLAAPAERRHTGRAAQLGTTGAAVLRDGVAAPRPVRRSTFYRNVEGWLLVR